MFRQGVLDVTKQNGGNNMYQKTCDDMLNHLQNAQA